MNDEEDSWLYGDVDVKIKMKTDEEVMKKIHTSTIDNTGNKDIEDSLESENHEFVKRKDDDTIYDNNQDNEKKKNAVEEVPDEDLKKVNKENEDSDSDDDVQVTIGEITTGNTPNFPTTKSFYRNPVALPTAPKPLVKGLDINTPGDINGVPVMDANLDSIEDKPWTKPGSDLSDYFNYGFNENSWKIYCEKQKRLRGEGAVVNAISLPLTARPPLLNGSSNILGTPKLQRQYNPIPQTFDNTVRTISTLQVSRRKDEELSPNSAVKIKTPGTSDPVSHSPTTVISQPSLQFPPVGIPSQGTMFPPINKNQPPPGLHPGMPPPGFPMPGMAPPGMPPIPGMVMPPGASFPPRGFPGIPIMPQPYFDPNVDGNLSDGKHDDRYSDDDGHYRRERSLSSRRDGERDRREYRDRDKRERDRERYRDRERMRSDTRDRSDRERSDRENKERSDRSERLERSDRADRTEVKRSDRDYETREPSRDRYREDSRRRDREDSHKSTRRKHEDDDRYSSTKHKKAKKHKHKDKDNDLSAPGTEEIQE